MERTALSNMDAFKITDHRTGEIFYGCNQDWFGKAWQRLSGCGPSVVANILIYRAGGVGGMERAVSLMEEVWKYVTPTRRGIPTVGMLLERVMSYAAAKELSITHRECEVPEDKILRPSIDELSEYIGNALKNDEPVAFLNLCRGDEANLDEWHWVTIVSLENRAADGRVLAGVMDRGRVAPVDISLWLETTSCGGGFAHFGIA